MRSGDRGAGRPDGRPQRIAVIGGGVAGLTTAWLLNRRHEVELFERNDYAGGHTRTVVVPEGPDAGTPVDTGFIVMNQRNYPLFTRMLQQLGAESRDSEMSFSYSCEQSGYAYAGTNVRTLFAQARNMWNAQHWKMIADIIRFNRQARTELLNGTLNGHTLSEYLDENGYGKAFAHHYLFAMGSAIWSSPHADIGAFPVKAFIDFFSNHGLLSLHDRPQWKYVLGGSRQYVKAITRKLEKRLHLEQPARHVRRQCDRVVVTLKDGSEKHFDQVVIATHADEALGLLADPSHEEKMLLGAWRYQDNVTVLHSDRSVMPAEARAWASWNFTREAVADAAKPVSITYDMNRLQRLRTHRPYFVSLNRNGHVDKNRVINRTIFSHPVYTKSSMASQPGLPGLNGVNRTYFCGSYFGYGFHEDAVKSAVDVAAHFDLYL